MKTTIDKASVAAIAYAALAKYPRELHAEAEWNQPDRLACGLLCADMPEFSTDDDFYRALCLYGAGFSFALQLGARIGADPLHAPEIEDLIKQHRIEQKDAA